MQVKCTTQLNELCDIMMERKNKTPNAVCFNCKKEKDRLTSLIYKNLHKEEIRKRLKEQRRLKKLAKINGR